MVYKEVLHIGANKSASTTLQRCLFPKLDEVVYLGEDCANYEDYRKTLNNMIYEDDFNYSNEAVELIFTPHIEKAKKHNKTFLYSNEDIMTSRVPSQVLQRLKKLMPNATVVLIIRNQLEAIPSWYANHGAYLKNVPLKFWRQYVSSDEFMDHCLRFFNYGPLDCFMYYKVVNKYADVFGKDKIKILFFEDFIANKSKFISELSTILQINAQQAEALLSNKTERKRVTQRRYEWHKLSRYLPFLHESKMPKTMEKWISIYLDKGPKASDFGLEKWKSKLVEVYAKDNIALEKEFNLDLGKYGYPR